MKRTFLTILLACVSSGVLAEWVEVARTSSESRPYTVYIETSTIRKAGVIVKVWTMFDFAQAGQTFDNQSYLSMKDHEEFDCNRERMRVLVNNYFKGNLGKGDFIGSTSRPSPWQPVSPSSIGEAFWKFVCLKK